MLFLLQILRCCIYHVIMHIVASILHFMSILFMLSWVEHEIIYNLGAWTQLEYEEQMKASFIWVNLVLFQTKYGTFTSSNKGDMPWTR